MKYNFGEAVFPDEPVEPFLDAGYTDRHAEICRHDKAVIVVFAPKHFFQFILCCFLPGEHFRDCLRDVDPSDAAFCFWCLQDADGRAESAFGRENDKDVYQVNFSEAFKICRDYLRIHVKTTKMDVESLIAQNIEPIRPGRTFARQHRFKLPMSFCYRR
ncbi:MAG: hypothetical protein Q4D81_12730 [Eubacteriales bacterium]|nr:hypothetical protein [Eubacteriales bacterium]